MRQKRATTKRQADFSQDFMLYNLPTYSLDQIIANEEFHALVILGIFLPRSVTEPPPWQSLVFDAVCSRPRCPLFQNLSMRRL